MDKESPKRVDDPEVISLDNAAKEIADTKSAIDKIQRGEKLDDSEAEHLAALPRRVIQNEKIWPIYVGLWKGVDKAMGSTRTMWDAMPGLVQTVIYRSSGPIQHFVRIGILDLKNSTDEEIGKDDKKRLKAAEWTVKIAALLDPEVRAIKPLLDAAIKAGAANSVINEELRTEIRAARIEDKVDESEPDAAAA